MVEDKIERVYCHHMLANADAGMTKKSFAEIVDKDSPGRTFEFSDDVLSMICVDLDAVERARSGANDRTMDCTFGIGRYDARRRSFVSERLLLVELKLNCVKHTLSASDYIDKVTHTRDLLVGRAMHGSNIFLFTERVKGRAQRDVFGWSRGSNGKILKTVQIQTPVEFNDYIGFESQYPYKPINDGESISAELEAVSADASLLADAIEKWKRKALQYRYANNAEEYRHILDTVRSTAGAFAENMAEDVDREYIRLIIGEI